MRWTEEELKDYERRKGQPSRFALGLQASAARTVLAVPAAQEQRRTSEPNKTESEAAAIYIEPRKLSGEVRRYRAHAMTLLLADRLRYTPDWVIWLPDGRLEFMEVKGGHVYDDSLAKFKMAVEQFPEHTFYWAQKFKLKQGGWKLVKHPARF